MLKLSVAVVVSALLVPASFCSAVEGGAKPARKAEEAPVQCPAPVGKHKATRRYSRGPRKFET